jgi:hypothetical protein
MARFAMAGCKINIKRGSTAKQKSFTFAAPKGRAKAFVLKGFSYSVILPRQDLVSKRKNIPP